MLDVFNGEFNQFCMYQVNLDLLGSRLAVGYAQGIKQKLTLHVSK